MTEPPPEAQPFWMRVWERLPRYKSDRVANGFLFLAAALVVVQLWSVQRALRAVQESEASPIHFAGPLRPERGVYYVGEKIRFRYERISSDPGLLFLALDGFENLETGELYPNPLAARQVHASDEVGLAVRFLPPRMTPGRYVLRGWLMPQTSRRTLTVGYVSEPFEVRVKR